MSKGKKKPQPKPEHVAPASEPEAPDPLALPIDDSTDEPEAPPEEGLQPELRPGVQLVSLQLPLAEIVEDGGYRGRGLRDKHCEARLDRRQADTLRQLFNGLDTVGERLRSGKRIASNADVVRWILEKVAEGEGK